MNMGMVREMALTNLQDTCSNSKLIVPHQWYQKGLAGARPAAEREQLIPREKFIILPVPQTPTHTNTSVIATVLSAVLGIIFLSGQRFTKDFTFIDVNTLLEIFPTMLQVEE